MINDSDIICARHLESVAAAAKFFTINNINLSSGDNNLDTVPMTVNGGMWYEVEDNKPVVKIYYSGNEYPLGSGALEPTLTVAPSSLNISVGESASATISCDSGGNYLVTSLTEGVTAELSGNVITVNHVLGIEEASIKIRVMASSGFNAAEILLPVEMEKADPNLQVALTSGSTINCNSSNATATVSYNSAYTGGQPTITPSPNVPYTYTGGVISVPYADINSDVTFTVSLAASPGFISATETFTVTMAKLDPQLTLTPSTLTVPFSDSVYVDVDFDGAGEISLEPSNSLITYNPATKKIKIDWAHNADTTVNVNLTASTGYTAASTSFTVTMAKPKTILTVTPSTRATKGDPVTATVECNSGGTITVSSNNTKVKPTRNSTTGIITIPWYLFDQDTYVKITVRAAASGDYPAATQSFTVTYFGGTSTELASLAVCLPFNTSLSEDLCGGTLSIVEGEGAGTPQIENGVLHMPPLSGLVCNLNTPCSPANGLTVSCWVYIVSGSDGEVFQADGMGLRVAANGTALAFCGQGAGTEPLNQWFHFEGVFQPNSTWARMFVNGTLKYSYLIDRTDFSSVIFGNNEDPDCGTEYWNQNEFYIANFKIYPSCLHTESFTCPTRPSLPSIT